MPKVCIISDLWVFDLSHYKYLNLLCIYLSKRHSPAKSIFKTSPFITRKTTTNNKKKKRKKEKKEEKKREKKKKTQQQQQKTTDEIIIIPAPPKQQQQQQQKSTHTHTKIKINLMMQSFMSSDVG